MFVVTEYWNNGEAWEDEYHSEIPIYSTGSLYKLIDFIHLKAKIDKNIVTQRLEYIDVSDKGLFTVYDDYNWDKKLEYQCPYIDVSNVCEYQCCGGIDKYFEIRTKEDNIDLMDDISDNLYPEEYNKCQEHQEHMMDHSFKEYRIYVVESE